MAGATAPRVSQADIRREGSAIVVPEGMPLEAAIKSLERRLAFEEETTEFHEPVECFPWDGAVALNRVLMRRYGWAQAEATPGFFGKEPPQMIGVDVGPNQVLQVPWGRFSLPNIKGFIETGAGNRDGRIIFNIHAIVLRKHEEDIRKIAEEVRLEVQTRSIYRGKTLKMRFTKPDGRPDPMPSPRFLDVSSVHPDQLVYSEHVKRAIVTNLLTPLECYRELANYGLPFKRGVLLAGKYGTGKTLAAFLAANRANANGITFVYVEKSAEFTQAVTFARQYLPAVVFCEDIDRITSGERDAHMDAILNTIDGIDSKTGDLMVVLTTNDVNVIHQGMMRPGRLDAIIEVEPPDGKAVENLIRLYARGLLEPKANLSRVGDMLAGEIPAVVREVVERAKLSALGLQSIKGGVLVLTEDALLDSAHTMQMQIRLLNRSSEVGPNELEQFGSAFGKAAGEGLKGLAVLIGRGSNGQVYDANVDELVSEMPAIDSRAQRTLALAAEPNHER